MDYFLERRVTHVQSVKGGGGLTDQIDKYTGRDNTRRLSKSRDGYWVTHMGRTKC